LILAAIDIGSNAARLLITEVITYKDGTTDFTKLNLVRIPLRLGLDVFSQGHISAEKEKQTLATMKAFKLLLGVYKVNRYRVCATSAMRDAKNGAELVARIKKQTGLNIEIISGAEEATLLYETHIAELMHDRRPYLYVDVGGGSTEVTLFSQNLVVFKESFNIGTLRLLENQVTEEQWEHMKWVIKKHTRPLENMATIGSGGNINKIFSISKRKEGKPLSLELLKDYHKELSSSTVEERMHLYHLRRDRADVIVPALQLYTSIMRWAHSDIIYVPKIGLADGLIRMLYKEQLNDSK